MPKHIAVYLSMANLACSLLSIFLLSAWTSTGTPDLSKPSYTVYLFLTDECTICRYYGPDIRQLSSQYNSLETIEFIGIFPNFSSKPAKIESFMSDMGWNFEWKTDYSKKLTKRLGATKTPEIVIVNNANEEVEYRGRIDDAYYSIGRRQRVIKSRELKTILESISLNQKWNVSDKPAIGCIINRNDNVYRS